MADLEAQTRIDTTAGGSAVREIRAGQYSWRQPLTEKKPIRLGSDPAQSDWAVPEDRMISRFHAILEWDGSALTVTRRGVLPDHPNLPQNHIWFRNSPTEKCVVRPGEWFVIGQTRFTVRGDGEKEPESPVDGTMVQRQEEFTRAQLEEVPFANPSAALKAMEQLPNYLRLATTEPTLFKQMLRVILDALPRADAVGIVRVPPGTAAGVAVLEQNARHASTALTGEFVPSRKLSRRAVDTRKSCLNVWSTDPKDSTAGGPGDHEMTLGAMHQQGATPWAICTPFQDGSRLALYVSGRLTGNNPSEQRQLTEYQKIAELLVGLLESSRKTLRLAAQNTVLRRAWPSAAHKFLDNPDQLEAILKPQEKEVTVLFCDLRGYSRSTEAQSDDLFRAWREVTSALDVMSGAVTERGGVVAGFRGDAVLGFWGWPDPAADQVQRAADAALRIHEKLSGWLLKRKCGLGLTHGRALAGRMGAHDLAVVDLYGPIVNLAFRLEEMTKAFGVGIIVSDEIAARLQAADPDGNRWRTRPLGRVRPRGMDTVAKAHELITTSEPGSPWSGESFAGTRSVWDEAVELLTAGNWGVARSQLGMFPDDLAAQCLLRAMGRGERPAPPDWDGSFSPRPPEV